MQKAVYERIAEQMHDPIVEWRTCAVSGEPFGIFAKDKAFYDAI